jgi:type III restriction enzyme
MAGCRKQSNDYLIDQTGSGLYVDMDDLNILRNLFGLVATRTIIETFKKKINDLIVLDKGEAEIRDYIKISRCRPFVVKEQGYIPPQEELV